MSRSLIIERKPGGVIPQAYIEKVLAKYNVAMGFAAQSDGSLYVQQLDGTAVDLADAVKSLHESEFKDDAWYLWFTDNIEQHSEDSIQPFKLITEGEGEDEDVIIAAITSGEFEEFKRDEGTNDFNMAAEYLYPRINALYEQSGKDLTKTLTLMDVATCRAEIRKMALVPSGGIKLIPKEGAVLSFTEKMEGGMDFPWGSVSDNLGYTEGAVVTAAPSKKSNPFAKKATAEPGVKPPVEKEAEKETKDPLEVIVKKKPDIFYVKDGTLMAKPPGLSLKADREWWTAHLTAARPDDPKDIAKGAPATCLRSTSSMRQWLSGSPLETLPKQPDKDKPKTADADIHIPDQESKNVLPPMVQKHDKGIIAEMVKTGIPLMDITQLKEATSKFPKFTVQMEGVLSIRDILLMPQSHLKKMQSHTLAIIISELQGIIRMDHPDLVQAPQATKTETTKKTNPFAKKVA